MLTFEIYLNGKHVHSVPANSEEEALEVAGVAGLEGWYAVMAW